MSSEKRKPRTGAESGVGFTEPAGLEASTGYLLARVGMESRRRWARTLVEQELTPHHYSALIALDQLGAMSQHELSRHVGIDPRNAGPVVDQLETAGLVERRPDLSDRRRYAVTLSSRGGVVVGDLRQAADEAERQLLAPLNEQERRTLQKLLSTLFHAITDAPGPGPAPRGSG